MNVSLLLLKRNIGRLIRRMSSLEAAHPMDSEQSVNAPPPSIVEPPASGQGAEGGREDQSAGLGQEILSDVAPQEKKKQRQFDFSMSVSNMYKCDDIHDV